MIDADKLNKAVSQWVKETVDEIIRDMHAKGVRHRDYSKSKQAATLLVKGTIRKKFGVVNKASIIFPRHLVFVKYGVGKYRPKGSGKEIPKDIFDNIIEKRIPLLADIAADAWADIIVKNLFIDKNRTTL